MNGDDYKEKQQAYLRAFNHYFPSWNREDGCIKQIKEDLEEIKKITDLEKKYQKVSFCWSKHKDNEAYARSKYNNGNLGERGVSKSDTIEKYYKLVKELWDLKVEALNQINSDKKTKQNNNKKQTNNQTAERERERERESKNNSSSKQPSKSQRQTEQTQQEQPLYCDGLTCSKKLPNEHYYNLTENNNKKFCSENCYINYYGDYCPLCKKKHLITYHWDKEKYPDLTFCENCYNKKKLEEEKEKLEQKNKRFCGICNQELITDKEKWDCICNSCVKNMFEKAEKDKLDSKNDLMNNNQIDNLKSEINQLEKSSLNSQSRKLLASKKQELSKLEKKLKEKQLQTEPNNNSKLILGIGCGVLGLGLVGLVIYLITKKQKERK